MSEPTKEELMARIAELEKQAVEAPHVREIVDFLATSTRGILR